MMRETIRKGYEIMRQAAGPPQGSTDSANRAPCARVGKRRNRSVIARLAGLALGFAGLALAACSPTITKHGHQFRPSDLTQVRTGMTKGQVTQVLGTPDTTSPVAGGTGFYYISSISSQVSFMKADEVDRKVVAVYFNELDSVERIANYGLKDGKVFDFISRQTPSHANDEGILKALFRNLGKKQGLF